jgi:RHS repeat-associated protein
LQIVLNNEVIEYCFHDSFGNILNDTNPTLNIPIGFAGGLYDYDTKLTKFGYRDYDSYTGRWITKDPIDFDGGSSNLYGYVLNDPVNFVDTEGLAVNIAGAIIIGGITIYVADKALTYIEAMIRIYHLKKEIDRVSNMCNYDKCIAPEIIAACKAAKKERVADIGRQISHIMGDAMPTGPKIPNPPKL